MPTSEFVHQITPDIVAEQLDNLRRRFPAVITEGEGGPRVDFDRLRAASTTAADFLSCTWSIRDVRP